MPLGSDRSSSGPPRSLSLMVVVMYCVVMRLVLLACVVFVGC